MWCDFDTEFTRASIHLLFEFDTPEELAVRELAAVAAEPHRCACANRRFGKVGFRGGTASGETSYENIRDARAHVHP